MTKQEIYDLIDDIIKVNPDAVDTEKLQGYRHRILLKTIVDLVGGAGGDFPFDWTQPSNAFGGYSNSEKTFAPGMWKFLHRDAPPAISLSADNPVRERGADRAVTLRYAAQAGSVAVKQIVVDTVVYNNPTRFTGAVTTNTAPNTDTHYTATVKDINGAVASAGCDVRYLDKRVAFSAPASLAAADDNTVSAAIRAAAGELADSRYLTSTVSCNNTKLYVAYPVAFGEAGKIVLNDFEDNSFSERVFNYSNSSGFTSQYILYVSENKLFGDNKISIN